MNGFQTTMELYKLDASKLHASDNSFWYYRTKELPDVVSPICEGCEELMRVCNGIGCLKYREYFVKNWNEKICRKPKKVTQEKKKREFFQYEHPDLVREGIVFDRNAVK